MRLSLPGIDAKDSINWKIFKAALTVGLVTVLVKASVMVKEVVVAHSFGRGDSLDAFLIAWAVPTFLMTILVGAVAVALVPVLVETRLKEDMDAGQRLLSTFILIITLGLVVLAILLGLSAGYYLPYLARAFSPEKLLLTRKLLYLLLPWVVFSGLSNLFGAVLNAAEKFALPALIPSLTPLTIMGLLIFRGSHWGAFSLATGTVIGSILEAAVLFRLLKTHGMLAQLRWYGVDSHVVRVLQQSMPMIAGAFLTGGTTLVDQSFAAMLPSGSVAALNYANKLVTGLLAIGATALGTAALPYFSQMAAEHDWRGCRHTLKRYFVLVLSVTVPLTILLIACSRPLIRLLLQRGAFTSVDTDLVSRVQAFYFIQIPFVVLGMLFVRFISSVKRNDMLLYTASLSFTINIVMNVIFMRFWGIAGIALSTSVVSCVVLLFLTGCSAWLLQKEALIALTPVPEPQEVVQ